MKLGFVGTGLMGRPMAARLLAAGHEVVVYNRTREKAEALLANGARVADRPADVFAFGEATLLMVSDAAAVNVVLDEAAAPAALPGETRAESPGKPPAGKTTPALAGRAVVNLSTIGPDESKAILRRVREAGGEYLEAPVLGSIPLSQLNTDNRCMFCHSGSSLRLCKAGTCLCSPPRTLLSRSGIRNPFPGQRICPVATR